MYIIHIFHHFTVPPKNDRANQGALSSEATTSVRVTRRVVKVAVPPMRAVRQQVSNGVASAISTRDGGRKSRHSHGKSADFDADLGLFQFFVALWCSFFCVSFFFVLLGKTCYIMLYWTNIKIHVCLVVQPLWKISVSWDHVSQYMENIWKNRKWCEKTTHSLRNIFLQLEPRESLVTGWYSHCIPWVVKNW